MHSHPWVKHLLLLLIDFVSIETVSLKFLTLWIMPTLICRLGNLCLPSQEPSMTHKVFWHYAGHNLKSHWPLTMQIGSHNCPGIIDNVSWMSQALPHGPVFYSKPVVEESVCFIDSCPSSLLSNPWYMVLLPKEHVWSCHAFLMMIKGAEDFEEPSKMCCH